MYVVTLALLVEQGRYDMQSTQYWVDIWLKSHVAGLSLHSRRQYESAAENFAELAPELKDFNGRVFRAYFRSLHATPTKANRWKAVLSSFCSWLVEEDMLDHNPVAGMKKFKEKPRSRYMTERELQNFSGALNHCEADRATVACIRFLLTTGCRLSEATGLVWEELHIQSDHSAEWHLPASRNKSGRDFITWIPPEFMLELTGSLEYRLYGNRGRVFRSAASGSLRGDAIQRCMKRLCVRMEMPHFSPHDLRRTVGTHMARIGISSDIRKSVLNHASSGVTDIHYNQYDYWQEKVAALQLWKDLLTEHEILKNPAAF